MNYVQLFNRSLQTLPRWGWGEWVPSLPGEMVILAEGSSPEGGAAVSREQQHSQKLGRGAPVQRGDLGGAPADLNYPLHADNATFTSVARSLPPGPDSYTQSPAQHFQIGCQPLKYNPELNYFLFPPPPSWSKPLLSLAWHIVIAS